MHISTTKFPIEVDDRSYYSDITLQHTDILNGHRELVKREQYKQASQYLYDNIEVGDLDVDYNGAYLWNAFENKLPSIENYAIDMEATDIRGIYSNTEPSDQPKNRVWIS